MALSNAISNALSGLTYAARGTEVVASNIANAKNPGYARREIQLSARPYIANGGGVQVDGIVRVVQESIVTQNRLALADLGGAETLANHGKAMEEVIGIPSEAGSMTATLAEFESALISATGRPGDDTALSRVATMAVRLTDQLNRSGRAVQEARTTADQAIAVDTTRLSKGLDNVADLNRRIVSQLAAGEDATALMDQRQSLIDDLSEIVPMRALPRPAGRVALVTEGGALLLDGAEPLKIEFNAAGPIAPHHIAGTPPVGFLTIEGQPQTADQMILFAGGRLAANFAIRDQLAPGLQASLDGFARDLYDRMADPAVDPTRTTLPPLFTDQGVAFAAANEAGFANRIEVNAVVLPQSGGALWRLRDGIEAAAPGPAGASGALGRMLDAMRQAKPIASASFPGGQRSAASVVGEIATRAGTARLDAGNEEARAKAHQTALGQSLRSDAVDTDAEMERLLGLEQAYAANAKVIKAVDEMIQEILRM